MVAAPRAEAWGAAAKPTSNRRAAWPRFEQQPLWRAGHLFLVEDDGLRLPHAECEGLWAVGCLRPPQHLHVGVRLPDGPPRRMGLRSEGSGRPPRRGDHRRQGRNYGLLQRRPRCDHRVWLGRAHSRRLAGLRPVLRAQGHDRSRGAPVCGQVDAHRHRHRVLLGHDIRRSPHRLFRRDGALGELLRARAACCRVAGDARHARADL
mmetsp:Transcript_99571/g.286019  ORF Transcript_99571/g.286019 Transcript_99571/m.286019 type:complete len:206 (-) Transcript_99571:343-960(-)